MADDIVFRVKEVVEKLLTITQKMILDQIEILFHYKVKDTSSSYMWSMKIHP